MVLAGSALLPRQCISMDIRDHCVGICNNRVGVRNHCASVRDYRVGARNDHVGIDCQFCLKGGPLGSRMPNRSNDNKRTLKMLRTPPMFCFQAAILSLSPFARMNREAAFRLPCLTTFLWISAKVLRSKESVRDLLSVHIAGPAHVVRPPIASRTGLLSSSSRLPSNLR